MGLKSREGVEPGSRLGQGHSGPGVMVRGPAELCDISSGPLTQFLAWLACFSCVPESPSLYPHFQAGWRLRALGRLRFLFTCSHSSSTSPLPWKPSSIP